MVNMFTRVWVVLSCLLLSLPVGCGARDNATSPGGDNGGGGSGGTGSPSLSDDAGGLSDNGGSLPTPSCAPGGPGMTTCPDGTGTESCCTSLAVPGGTYDRVDLNDLAPATVSSFRLDKYLVTVGRFRQFVNAWNNGSGWMPAAGSGKHTHLNGGQGLMNVGPAGGYELGWNTSDNGNIAPTDTGLMKCGAYSTWTSAVGSQEDLPINCVYWEEAYAFCIWDGGFLPSEAEWGYAAAGGDQQRQYPWGTADPGTNNQYAIYGGGSIDCYYPSGTLAACAGASNIAPVGHAPQGAGLWGQQDMAGELDEWNLDSYNNNGFVVPCADCVYLTTIATTFGRVGRGGSFFYGSASLLTSTRNNAWSSRYTMFGFRCARTP
jgi:formylglycine-generating enzyme